MSSKHLQLNNVGQKYQDFEVTKAIEIPELKCFLRELVHIPTNAQIMHIENEDPENLFCLSFQTLPYNSDGVAHILEHTVLCGSEKFPVKDPFFAMNRRSLNTFMNAMTGSDFTCYPAATQVKKDFYNLLEVYLDAVFKPCLNVLSFRQEGHRLEFATPDDPSSPLEFKGIVYNEMKGAMASANARMGEEINKALFPDTIYGYNSGGDPKVIPSLTYKKLCDFHQKYYHPSRCLFFFYGNMPLQEHLDFIAEHTLNDAENLPKLPPIPNQPRFTSPRTVETSYPASPKEELKDKTMIAFAWLTSNVLNQQETLALNILEIILLGNDAAPLKRALLKSGFCKQVSAYLETDINDAPLSIVLKGCPDNSLNELEKLLWKTLKQIVLEGIPIDQIENALHQLEFYRSEITGDHAPFGLSLFMRSALLKQHGAQAEDGLEIHSLFEELRKAFVADPNFFGDLIEKYLINNQHFVKIVLKPDPSLEGKESAEEKATLEEIRKHLTPHDTQKIVQEAAELSDFQKKQEEEDLDVLPKVSLEDVPKHVREYELKEEKIGNLTLFHHECFTNKIVYADLVYNLPQLREEDLIYVRLLTALSTQMGCGGRDYVQNLDYIQAHTGSISTSLSLNLQVHHASEFYPSLAIRGKALHHKANKLFPLIHEMTKSIDFTDIPRLKEVILKHFTLLESGINQNALKYALNLSAKGLNIASKMANTWYGLDYFKKIREIAQNFDEQAESLLEKLIYLQDQLLGLENPHLVITCNAKMYDELKGNAFYGLQDIETKPYKPWTGDYPLEKIEPQGRIIASPIAFIAKVFNTVSYTHPDSPALNVAAHLFDNLTLHTKIREQGGAYGGGASSNAMSGNFYFYSYRDPNISATFNAFEEAIDKIIKGNFDDFDLEEAKLEIIQGMDSPLSPGSRGDLAYAWYREGKTTAIRQAYRERLLSLTKKEVIKVVKQKIQPNLSQGVAIVFAGKELLERENTLLEKQNKPPLTLKGI